MYREPRPQAKLAPHAPWWRILRAWLDGTMGRISARARRVPQWYPPCRRSKILLSERDEEKIRRALDAPPPPPRKGPSHPPANFPE